MKNFQSIIEGTWKELLTIELTESQLELLNSSKEDDVLAKVELNKQIQTLKQNEVSAELSEKLNKIYNLLKPELKEKDTFELISADFSEKSENVFTGVINYKFNKEHKQIKF